MQVLELIQPLVRSLLSLRLSTYRSSARPLFTRHERQLPRESARPSTTVEAPPPASVGSRDQLPCVDRGGLFGFRAAPVRRAKVPFLLHDIDGICVNAS